MTSFCRSLVQASFALPSASVLGSAASMVSTRVSSSKRAGAWPCFTRPCEGTASRASKKIVCTRRSTRMRFVSCGTAMLVDRSFPYVHPSALPSPSNCVTSGNTQNFHDSVVQAPHILSPQFVKLSLCSQFEKLGRSFFFLNHHGYFPAQLVGGFTLSDLLDKPWSQRWKFDPLCITTVHSSVDYFFKIKL